jgi:hypothetical protein
VAVAVPATAVRPPRADAIEVLLTLSLSEYEQMGADLNAIRGQLDLPKTMPNDEVIREALRHLARGD